MTAYRVIDDHDDLDNIGSHTHDEIDSHIESTPFLVVSGAVPPVTSSSARYLEAGTGIQITDNGPGGSFVIASTVDPVEFTFPNDLSVSLPNGKSFGRYGPGQTIPATGKTPAEVILLAIAEPLDPTVTLTASNILTSAFNTTGSVTTPITASYVINSAGASVSATSLQFRMGGVGPWTTLTTSTSNPLNYDHIFNADPFLTSTLNYQYTVTDTQSATNTATTNLTPQPYAAPTMSLTVSRTTPGGVTGETNTKREKGNTSSTITGTITRQRVNVPITSYSVQYSLNGSAWFDVPGLSSVSVSGNPASVTIPSTVHDDAALKNKSTLYYRVRVTDEYTTTNSSTTTITFLNVIFYGPSSIAPDATGVRSLPSKVFTDTTNPFNLETGDTYRHFTAALPNSFSVTEILDLDALNANITANYSLSTLNVDDGGGTSTSYKVYTMTNAIPYTSNHRHRITRA